MAVTLLDGGMGQELVRRSGRAPTPLWSTQVMIDAPEIVGQIHRDFFAAGAEIATANTYAIHRDRLAKAGMEARFEALHTIALDQAIAARDAHGAGRVAGAIGPLNASYRPDIHPPSDSAVPLFREVAEILAPRVDLILCESVASVAHADDILTATEALGVPVWLSVTVDDEDGHLLRSREPVGDIVGILRGRAEAVLINCAAPEAIPAALAALAPAGVPRGAYANGFTQITKDFLKDSPTVDALTARRDMGPEVYAGHAADWVAAGATIVGGCCEVGPAHIAALSARFKPVLQAAS